MMGFAIGLLIFGGLVYYRGNRVETRKLRPSWWEIEP